MRPAGSIRPRPIIFGTTWSPNASKRVAAAVLLTKVKTRPGVSFSRKELDEDIKRLTKLGKFLPISAEWKDTAEGIEVTFSVRDREDVKWVRFAGRGYVLPALGGAKLCTRA